MVKQLEGLFAELSATVYGLPLLVWRVGRSPVRGTLRLHVRRLKQDAHIGPHSAVLLAASLLVVWSGQTDRVRQFAGGLLAGGSGLTEPIVTSVLLAAFIDGGCRLFARIRYRRDLRRRSRAVAMLLYASAFALLTIGPFFWLALSTSAAIDRLGLPHGSLAGLLFVALLCGAALASSWPSMAVYASLRHGRLQDDPIVSMLPFAFLFLFMAAPILGHGIVLWLQTPLVHLSSPYTRCTLDDDAVGVVAVLHNHTSDVMVVDSRNLGVRLDGGKSHFISQLPLEVTRSSLAFAGGLITIPPDAVALVEATADPRHPRRSNDLRAETYLERCELIKMDEQQPLWLGESGRHLFDWLPVPRPLRPWPVKSQETFDGTGAIVDRRRSSTQAPAQESPTRSP